MSIQGRAVQRAVLPAVTMVVMAWWAAFFIYELAFYPRWFLDNFGALVGHVWTTFLMATYGTIAGVSVVLFVAHVRRQDKAADLTKGALRNLTTTMGDIPIAASEPERAAVPPLLSTFGEPGEKMGAWLKAMATISPAHARLMEALLRVFNHDPLLPATHIQGGHGGKTLLQHSLLVTQAMLEMAPSWSYEGLRNKKGDIVIGLRNPAYRFNPVDPILAIVAFAHDMGKIECYIKKGGKVVDSRHAHDVVGARMIARMPEFWGIPKDDREAIVLAIAHYHRPQDLPMHEDGRAIDDRTIASMELLIKSDKAAGKIESGVLYENTMGEAAGDEASPAAKLIDDEVLYNAFIEIIHEPGRINGKDSATRVGQKHGGMLYLAESALRVALIRKLGLSSTPVLGDGRSALTVQIMELLSERGLLMQEFGGKTYSFKRAMFRVAFFNSRSGKHLADWPAVLIVNPGSNLPKISSMVDHLSRVEITRPVWGESSAKGKAEPPASKAAEAAAEDAVAEPPAPASVRTPDPVPASESVFGDDDDEMVFEAAPSVAPPVAPPGNTATDDDDFIGALMMDDDLPAAEPEQPAAPPSGEPVEEAGAEAASSEIVFVDEESGGVFEAAPDAGGAAAATEETKAEATVSEIVFVDEEGGMVFEADPSVAPPIAPPAVNAAGGEDLIGALVGDDQPEVEPEHPATPASSETVEGAGTEAASSEIVFIDEEGGVVFEAASDAEPVSPLSFEMADDDEPLPDIPEETEDDVPQVQSPVAGAVESFNRVVKKLGSGKPLKGLNKGHLERLGDKLQDGVDAALANLEKLERKPSGRPYSRAMLLVEKEKLKELLRAGSITLYSSAKGGLLALDEVVAARGRFGWDEAVSEAESGDHDVFTVIRSGERVFLKFTEFQTQ